MWGVFEGNGVGRFHEVSVVDRNERGWNSKPRFPEHRRAERCTTYEQPSPTKQAAREVMIARCNYLPWLAFSTLRVTMTRYFLPLPLFPFALHSSSVEDEFSQFSTVVTPIFSPSIFLPPVLRGNNFDKSIFVIGIFLIISNNTR